MESEPLFVPDGPRFLPTKLTRGPWSPDGLHGGAVAALAARVLEQAADGDGLQMVRFSLELLTSVPVAPLAVSVQPVRPGRRISVTDVTIEADGRPVALARGVRIRTTATGASTAAEAPPEFPENPMAPVHITDGYRAFHNGAVEFRFVRGAFNELGPAVVWFALVAPVLPGEDPSPWVRAVAAADFANGVSGELDFTRHLFVNTDLTVSLFRPPEGPWVCLEAATRLGTPGIGTTETTLWDRAGRIGTSLQSLYREERP